MGLRWKGSLPAAQAERQSECGQRRHRFLIPRPFRTESIFLAKGVQLAQVRHRLDLQVPAQLAQADRAKVQWPAIPLLLVVTAVHQAPKGDAVPQGQDMTKFVGRCAQGPAQAQTKGGFTRAGIAVAVDGPDARAFSE